MHAPGFFVRTALVLALLCALAPAALASGPGATPDNAIGSVAYLTGEVMAERTDGDARTLAQGEAVRAGDIIVTAASSCVEIVFKDGSVFSQGAQSRTALDGFVYTDKPSASKMLLKMAVGTARYVTGKIVEQNPEGFAFETTLASIGIRGTGIFAVVSPEREEIGVLSMTPGHTVSVTSATQSRTIGRAGYSVSVSTDGRISPPAPVAPATRSRVIRSAPQTSRGEEPDEGLVSQEEIDTRIKAFEAALDRTKSELGGVDNRPDYNTLHELSLLKEGKRTAEGDQHAPSATVPSRALKAPTEVNLPAPTNKPVPRPKYF
ncbi:MAG: hypothetical protein AB7D39_01720 [Pseudodesulfovibrio sp.]|uniref:FecR family protein n=1 Tax=Pseudodesulfovibrio sp. TaxID=2035812 RepID=UPI003D095E4C